MRDVQAKLDELADRLNRIRRKLRQLPAKREELESIYDELKSQWPQQLAREAVGEISADDLEQFRQSLAEARRAVDELAELQVGLEKMEKQVMNEMRPLQKKLRLEQAKARYSELYEKLKTNGYDKRLAEKLRVTAHEINRDKECNQLLKRLEYQRNQTPFGQLHGLRVE